MKSFQQRVLEVVLRLGTCSIDQVIAEVGHHISASTAAAYWRNEQRYEAKRGSGGRRTDDRGVRIVVTRTLSDVCRAGKIRRIGRGVYAAPLPRLFEAPKETA